MGLPRIELPKYNLTLPSSMKEVQYRPFTVKEQKVMLMAVGMDSAGQLMNAVKDVATSCTFDKLDIDSTPIADIEYLMLNIRKHSVGEVLELNYKCNNTVEDKPCGSSMVSFLNLSEVEVKFPKEHDYNLVLSDNVGMKLKDLDFGAFKALKNIGDDTISSDVETIINCVESIYDDDGVYLMKNFPSSDIETWIETLSLTDFEKLELFTETMPTLEHEIELKCLKCGHVHNTVLSGLDDFLD